MAVDKRATRLGVLALVGVLLFSALGVRLWFLQTVRQEELQALVTSGKTRTVLLVPERGRIFDIDGRILADNERILTVGIDWQVLRRDKDRFDIFSRLSGRIDVPIEEMEARFQSGRYSTFLPMPVKEDISEPEAIALMERVEDFPGVSVIKEWRRVYPYAPLASHVVGYMGAVTDEYLAIGYDRNERVGQGGVERSMEQVLHGKWGRIVYEVDALNRPVRQLEYTPPVNGQDVQLSIDLDLQQYAEQALQTQLELRRGFTAKNPFDPETNRYAFPNFPELVNYPAPAGSVVVTNYETGLVHAMASYPNYDNRWFNAGITGEKFASLFPTPKEGEKADPDKSALTNRAVQGQYNMGSAFKPFTAYAALHAGLIGPNTFYDDTGEFKFASIDDSDCALGVKCILRNAICGNGKPCVYGNVNVTLALAVSSDAFFYDIGERFYITPGLRDTMQQEVRGFGFDEDTGIDLPFEYDGRVPDNESKKELVEAGVLAEGEEPRLLVGDNVQTAIGQGLLAATPLQLAVAYGTLANGGFVLQPRVVMAIYAPGVPDGEPGFADLSRGRILQSYGQGTITRQIPMSPELRDPIVSGLRRNVTGPGVNGRSTTAEELFDVGYDGGLPVAGKTGTAQGAANYPWFDSSVFGAFTVGNDGNSPNYEYPFTVVAYLENSGYGSRGAGPVAKCLFLVLGGQIATDEVKMSDPLDITSTQVAEPSRLRDSRCMDSKDGSANPYAAGGD
jgi:penicillin-binding protein 2